MIREIDFYRKFYQTKFRGDDTKTFQIFGVPIGNAKITRKVQFHPVAHHQNTRKEFLTPFVVLEMLRLEQSKSAAAAA